jgi:carbonic anhydrase
MDSRTSATLIFDQGIGDIFEVRIAGNFVDTEVLGSMEYAVEHAHAKTIVVVGHSHCGAAKGAADNVKEGNLGKTLLELQEAVKLSKNIAGEHNSKNEEYVNSIAKENIQLGIKEILAKSPVIKKLVEEGSVSVVGAFYDVETGIVEFLK